MTPTLAGRLQTRIIVLTVVGGAWTLVVTPLLPARGPLPSALATTMRVLVIVLLLGIVWELIYHLLQQFRWEKDWPPLFGLLTGINEGLLAYSAAARIGVEVTVAPYTIHFATTWLVVWFVVYGPMRVVFLRWRFNGGRVV